MAMKIKVRFYCVLSFLLASAIWANEESRSTWRFSGIPALSFDSDSGFGGGIIGNAYEDEPGYDPFKLSIGVKAFITTKLVQSHMLKVERIKAFGLPWRLMGRLGFYSTITQNYCGKGSDARCDEDRAQRAVENLKIPENEQEQFRRRYYQNRYMWIYGDIFSRWLLWEGSAGKLELMTGYHGSYYLNRDFKQKGPYPNSLFAKDFAVKKQDFGNKLDGYLSMVDVGLMLDKRDVEAAPTSGYWLESSIRGAASFIGSAWDVFGVNLAARFYWPLDQKRQLVVASQTIGDALFGNMPYDPMSRIGGSLYMSDFSAIGGTYIGRGIREQLFVGRFKAIEQLEFRYNFWSFELWRQQFGLTAALFGDFGMTAWDYSRFKHDMSSVHIGFGSGLRLLWNNTFVVRGDIGMSPDERFHPRIYLVVGNVF